MCRMWQRIRNGVRWSPHQLIASTSSQLTLQRLQRVHVQFDPFHSNTNSIRQIWQALSDPTIQRTNASCALQVELTNDRKAPVLTAFRDDGKTLVFKTEKLSFLDLLRYFNKHTAVAGGEQQQTSDSKANVETSS